MSYFHRHNHPYRRKVNKEPVLKAPQSEEIERASQEVFFCGDPHGYFDHILKAAQEHRPKAMVILGDLQPPAPMHEVLEDILSFVDVWWIPGNHDTDNDYFYDRLWRSELASHNLHGRVALVNGLALPVSVVFSVVKSGCRLCRPTTPLPVLSFVESVAVTCGAVVCLVDIVRRFSRRPMTICSRKKPMFW